MKLIIPLNVAYAQDRRFRQRAGVYHYCGPTPWRVRWARAKWLGRRIWRWLSAEIQSQGEQQ